MVVWNLYSFQPQFLPRFSTRSDSDSYFTEMEGVWKECPQFFYPQWFLSLFPSAPVSERRYWLMWIHVFSTSHIFFTYAQIPSIRPVNVFHFSLFEFNQLGLLYQHRIKRRSYVFNIEINFLSLWFAQLSMKKLSFMDLIPSSFPNSLWMLGP